MRHVREFSIGFHRLGRSRSGLSTSGRYGFFNRSLSTPSKDGKKASKKSVRSHVFWTNKANWIRASKNTLNCLIGCNIGDYGAMIALNYYQPELPFSYVMPIAMSSGLATSVLLETAVLKYKEGFSWRLSFKTAMSMSFMSMLAMESTENLMDYMLTGGEATVHDAWFWEALGISTVAGFMVPLPYNYYQLEQHGKACHQIPDKGELKCNDQDDGTRDEDPPTCGR